MEYKDYYDFSDDAAYDRKGVSYISEELYIARVADADGNRTQSNLNRVGNRAAGSRWPKRWESAR